MSFSFIATSSIGNILIAFFQPLDRKTDRQFFDCMFVFVLGWFKPYQKRKINHTGQTNQSVSALKKNGTNILPCEAFECLFLTHTYAHACSTKNTLPNSFMMFYYRINCYVLVTLTGIHQSLLFGCHLKIADTRHYDHPQLQHRSASHRE